MPSRCRSCSRTWYEDNRDAHRAKVRRNTKALHARNRKLMTDYLLQHPCVDCGERDVRCANCHRRVTVQGGRLQRVFGREPA